MQLLQFSRWVLGGAKVSKTVVGWRFLTQLSLNQQDISKVPLGKVPNPQPTASWAPWIGLPIALGKC